MRGSPGVSFILRMIAAVSVLGLSPSVLAVNVRNVSTNTQLFADGFEGAAAGGLPTYGNPGSWTTNGVVVVNDAVPGAFEGSNYVRVSRVTTGTAAVAVLSSSQGTAGNIIHCEVMMYIPSLNASGAPNPAFACQVLIRPNDAFILSSGPISAGSGDVLYYSAGHKATGLKFMADRWQKWEVDYAVGASTFTLKIDGNAVSGLTVNVPTPSVAQVWFTQGANNCRYYVDTTPPLLDPLLKITWHIGPDLPQGFQDSDGGIVDNTLITVGGFCQGEEAPSKPGRYPRGFLQKAWGLDLTDRQNGWFSLPDFPGAARQELFGAVVNDELYLWGGISYSAPYTYADGWKLTHQGGTWSWQALPGLPWAMTSSGIAVIGTKIYVCGGADYDTQHFYTNTNRFGGNQDFGSRLLVLDTTKLSSGWQILPNCPGTPRWVPALGPVNGSLYLIGGATGDDNPAGVVCSVVDNWVFNPLLDAWSRIADLPISSGNFPNGSNIVFGNRYIILVGGFQYQCAVNNRVPIAPYGTGSKAPQPGAASQNYYNDMFVYDTSTGQFGTADKLPLNNNLPMAVVRSTELFLIGGETGGSWLTDHPAGASYDPGGEYFGHHPDLCLIGQIEVVTVRPDLDLDRDVDLVDFDRFQACVSGAGIPRTEPACQRPDIDGDGDVDQADFGFFQRCMTGPDQIIILGCDR